MYRVKKVIATFARHVSKLPFVACLLFFKTTERKTSGLTNYGLYFMFMRRAKTQEENTTENSKRRRRALVCGFLMCFSLFLLQFSSLKESIWITCPARACMSGVTCTEMLSRMWYAPSESVPASGFLRNLFKNKKKRNLPFPDGLVRF